MLNVYKKLLGLSPNTSKEELRNMIRAAVFLVKRALLDKVSPVSPSKDVYKCMEVLQIICSSHCACTSLSRSYLMM